jgi:hypothetical protein
LAKIPWITTVAVLDLAAWVVLQKQGFSISHQGAKVSTTIVAVVTLAPWVGLQQTVFCLQ